MVNDTIYNNITMYDSTFSEEYIWACLQKVQLADEIQAMPKGIETLIGDNGVTLSSGQKQRLCLARAMILGKAIIILDEPTSAVDALTANIVAKAIYEIFKGRLLIIISHDESILQECDIRLKLENGNLTEI